VTARPAVYLAGPDVFLADAVEIGRAKQALCAAAGLEGRFPLDGPLPADFERLEPEQQGLVLFDACVTMMDGCVAGIANLTPFRGPSADVGTAFELGYLLASGRPVFGYTSHADDYAVRVAPDGLSVEAFGLADNLMLEGAVRRAGHPVVRVESDEPSGRVAAMAAFERCIRLVADALLA
jgi:nucleoside 2-deoxyribosyltransferase